MTALGISLIVAGLALVCAGLFSRSRAPQAEPAGPDQPEEFRSLPDALYEENRRAPEEKVHEPENRVPNDWEELKNLSGD